MNLLLNYWLSLTLLTFCALTVSDPTLADQTSQKGTRTNSARNSESRVNPRAVAHGEKQVGDPEHRSIEEINVSIAEISARVEREKKEVRKTLAPNLILAELQIISGKSAEARKNFEELISLAPDWPELVYSYSKLSSIHQK